MVDHPIDSGERRHRIFENSLPFAEDQVGREHDGFVLIALGEKRKEHFHLITILLNVANVIQNDTRKLVELGEFLGQTEIAFSRQEALH